MLLDRGLIRLGRKLFCSAEREKARRNVLKEAGGWVIWTFDLANLDGSTCHSRLEAWESQRDIVRCLKDIASGYRRHRGFYSKGKSIDG